MNQAPPRLEQFNAAYDALHDRILLRIRTSDESEYRFWITRRFLSLLWPVLMKMVDEFSALKSRGEPFSRSTLAELAHGEAVGKADFKSEYKDGSRFPLGEEPVLLAKISLMPIRGEIQRLVMLPLEGQGINLDLDERLAHVIARLLQQTAAGADWGLKLDIAVGLPSAGAEAAGMRLLH